MSQLFDIFQKLESQSWSGEIQVTASEGHCFIVMSKGQFVYAYRPLDRALEKLEGIEWIKTPSLESISHIKDWGEFVGKIIELNPNDVERLIQFFRVDRQELFFRIFFWTNLELYPRPFEVELQDTPELKFYKPKNILKMLTEAKSRLRDWPEIQKRIGSSKRLFVASIPNMDTSGRVLDEQDEIDQAILKFETNTGEKSSKDLGPYSEAEMRIIQLCDGRHNVQDIIRLSYEGEFLTLRRMCELWDKGSIAPKDEEPSSILKERKGKAISGKDVRAFVLVSFVLTAVYLIGFAGSIFDPPPKQSSGELVQALEVYRSLEGRYPVTLTELVERKVVENLSVDDYEYNLVNVQKYTLKKSKVP